MFNKKKLFVYTQTSLVKNNVNLNTLSGSSAKVTEAEVEFFRKVPLQDLQRYHAVYQDVR